MQDENYYMQYENNYMQYENYYMQYKIKDIYTLTQAVDLCKYS